VYRHRPWHDEDTELAAARRQTSGLIGFVIILLLLIAGLFLVHRLRNATEVEDCLLAGYRDCDALVNGQR
jgi:hypothetical protein